MEPITKIAALRIVGETFGLFAAYGGVTVVGLTFTNEEITAAILAVVWLVRLEGRLNTQTELLKRVERQLSGRREDDAL